MNPSIFLRKALQDRLAEIQTSNPRFSIRAFAKQLKLQSGTLSLILLGKRTISSRLAEKIMNGLGLGPDIQEKVRASLKSSSIKHTPKELKSLQLSSDHFQLLKDWRHFALLSLLNTRDFREDPKWMALRLGANSKECSLAWSRLRRMGLVQKTTSGNWKAKYDRIKTEDDQLIPALRYSHYEGLELAKEALSEEPLERREFNWLIIALDQSDLGLLKKRIRTFREQIIRDFGRQTEADEVYRLNLQLFPYTKMNSKAKTKV